MPFLFERRFGIRAFDYWYGYSANQIDLMVMDHPVINYGKDKKPGSMIATKSEVEELNELQEAWERKHKGKSRVGQKVSLGEFLKQ